MGNLNYTPGNPMELPGIGMVHTRINENGQEVPLMVRQGDVSFVKLVGHEFSENSKISDGLRVAEGEVTGHHHTLNAKVRVEHALDTEYGKDSDFRKVGMAGEPMVFEVMEVGDGIEGDEAPLDHDEHGTIPFEKGGIYRNILQRQYTPKKIERVVD